MNKIEEIFNFLFVGHWLKGDLGHDRKDISGLIKVFYETFKLTKRRPSLVLKTSGADFSHIDRREITSKIEQVKSTMAVTIYQMYILYMVICQRNK